MKTRQKNTEIIKEQKSIRIKKIRISMCENRISQKTLSKKSIVSLYQLNRILCGHIKNPQWGTIEKVEKALEGLGV